MIFFSTWTDTATQTDDILFAIDDFFNSLAMSSLFFPSSNEFDSKWLAHTNGDK